MMSSTYPSHSRALFCFHTLILGTSIILPRSLIGMYSIGFLRQLLPYGIVLSVTDIGAEVRSRVKSSDYQDLFERSENPEEALRIFERKWDRITTVLGRRYDVLKTNNYFDTDFPKNLEYLKSRIQDG